MALEEGTGVYRVPGIIMDVRNAISCYHEALEAEEMDLDDLYRVELGFDDEDIQDIANERQDIRSVCQHPWHGSKGGSRHMTQ